VLYGLVPAIVAVGVVVNFGGHVGIDPVLVAVTLVLAVDVPVVQIIDVAVVLKRDVTAIRGMLVRVLGVDVVCHGHGLMVRS
jgi:hypothetical protein